jgi:hypothetical protein
VEIAAVDSDEGEAESDGAVEFGAVVDLAEDVELVAAGFGGEDFRSASESAATMRRMASAPAARASRTWNESTMKSLRRQGIFTAEEARVRFWSEPWKNLVSVSTERAVAPATSSEVARATGSKSARMRPREGEAFFSSAMMAGPEAEALRRAASKPRGWCAAAWRSSRAMSAVARRARTSSKVCARILSSCVDIQSVVAGKNIWCRRGDSNPHTLASTWT